MVSYLFWLNLNKKQIKKLKIKILNKFKVIITKNFYVFGVRIFKVAIHW